MLRLLTKIFIFSALLLTCSGANVRIVRDNTVHKDLPTALTAAQANDVLELQSNQILPDPGLPWPAKNNLTLKSVDGKRYSIKGVILITQENIGLNLKDLKFEAGNGAGLKINKSGQIVLDIRGCLFDLNNMSAALDFLSEPQYFKGVIDNSQFINSTGNAIVLRGGHNELSISNSLFKNKGKTSKEIQLSDGAGSSLTIYNTTFDRGYNALALDGGVLKIASANFANYANGAVEHRGNGNLDIADTVFTNNARVFAGGAVYFSGNGDLSISNSSFTNNSSQSSGSSSTGGAVYFSGNGSLTLSKSSFIGNNSTYNNSSGGGHGAGGAVYFSGNGQLLIQDTVFDRNYNQANYFVNLLGGALYSNSDTLIENSVFRGNYNKRGKNSSKDYAWQCYGGALYQNRGRLTIKDSQFQDNYVEAQDDQTYSRHAYGGAIYLHENSGKLTIANSLFTGNYTQGNNKNSSLERSSGGAIFKNNIRATEIEKSHFVNNQARAHTAGANGLGGALYLLGDLSIKRSSFKNNTSRSHGAAIYLESGRGEIENTIFAQNKGSSIENSALHAQLAEFTVKHSTFLDNTRTLHQDTVGQSAFYNSILWDENANSGFVANVIGAHTFSRHNLSGTNIFSDDPQLDSQYAPSGESPVLNSGLADYGLPIDYYGATRNLQKTGYECGAVEYDDNPPPPVSTNYGTLAWTNQKNPDAISWAEAQDIGYAGTAKYYVYWGNDADGVTTNYQTPASFTPPTLNENGEYFLRVAPEDSLGNSSNYQQVALYRYDGDKPGQSSSTITVNWTNVPTASFTWDEAPDTGGSEVAGYYLYWGTSPSGETLDTASFCSGNREQDRTYHIAPTVSAVYFLRVAALDRAGNRGDWKTVLAYHHDQDQPGVPTTDKRI
ncbi:hypothetical protein NO2_0283, partial [Candidatus Termititenax persephonae]